MIGAVTSHEATLAVRFLFLQLLRSDRTTAARARSSSPFVYSRTGFRDTVYPLYPIEVDPRPTASSLCAHTVHRHRHRRPHGTELARERQL
jgi:hypothetical protein